MGLTGRSGALLALVSALGIASAIGCGDGENGDGAGGAAASAGKGGSSGSAGKGGTASDGGVGGEGNAGTGGSSSNEGGEGGEPESGGAGGAPAALWGDGSEIAGLSSAADDLLRGVVWDGNDTVYVAGQLAVADGDAALMVAKFKRTDEELELDDAYGDGGIATHNVVVRGTQDVTAEIARGLALQDGKVVVSGLVEHDPTIAAGTAGGDQDRDIVVVRFEEDGDLDETFAVGESDGNGVFTWNIADNAGKADDNWGLAVDADDKIVLFASGEALGDRTDRDRFVARLTKDGELDDTFGDGDGVYDFDVDGLNLDDNTRYGFVDSEDDSIFVAGYTKIAGRNQVALLRLLANGTPDTNFFDNASDNDGLVRLAPFALGWAEAYGAAKQLDGEYVTTGYGRSTSPASNPVDLVSFRLTSSGGFDASWGSNGTFLYDHLGTPDVLGTSDRGRHLAVLPDNRIIMAGCAAVGTASDQPIEDAMLLLLDKDGQLAPNFDPTGVKLWDKGGADEEFFSVAVSPDGKWVAAAGYSKDGSMTNTDSLLVLLPVGE